MRNIEIINAMVVKIIVYALWICGKSEFVFSFRPSSLKIKARLVYCHLQIDFNLQFFMLRGLQPISDSKLEEAYI